MVRCLCVLTWGDDTSRRVCGGVRVRVVVGLEIVVGALFLWSDLR